MRPVGMSLKMVPAAPPPDGIGHVCRGVVALLDIEARFPIGQKPVTSAPPD